MVEGHTFPLVSVVIPTRDRQRLLEQALGSVLAQRYEPIEVVVVDDCSALPLELSPLLARDPRVLLLRSETPLGAGAARNLGASRCRGPLLAFLDDDDRWRPDKLERQVAWRWAQRERGSLRSKAASSSGTASAWRCATSRQASATWH